MLDITGIWAGSASKVEPERRITVPASTSRIFYRFEQTEDLKSTLKSVVRVKVNGTEILKELADFKPGDPIDTGFFDVPMSMRTGSVGVVISVSEWADKPENAKLISESKKFEITYE